MTRRDPPGLEFVPLLHGRVGRDMTEHPHWCDRVDCDRRGAHCGWVTRIGDPKRRPLATIWVEQTSGRPVVRMGLPRGPSPRWTPEQARSVSESIAAMAKRVAGL